MSIYLILTGAFAAVTSALYCFEKSKSDKYADQMSDLHNASTTALNDFNQKIGEKTGALAKALLEKKEAADALVNAKSDIQDLLDETQRLHGQIDFAEKDKEAMVSSMKALIEERNALLDCVNNKAKVSISKVKTVAKKSAKKKK